MPQFETLGKRVLSPADVHSVAGLRACEPDRMTALLLPARSSRPPKAPAKLSSMPPMTPQQILDYLRELGIAAETVEHEAVFTVAESRPVKARIPGAHTKNLFLKDKKGRLFLITARDETQIDLKRTHEAIGASGRLSFGSAEQLRTVLGVEPGSVTALAVANDRAGEVTMILDAN